jgi:hypothetical protein
LAGRAALVGFVGTMLEYYDFIIYGAATPRGILSSSLLKNLEIWVSLSQWDG